MPTKPPKNTLTYKRSRLKRVWTKLVDVVGEDDEDLDVLRDFLDDLVDGWSCAGTFGEQGEKDPRKNGKQGELTIY